MRKPSIVVICWPEASPTVMTQERIATPPTWTVQARMCDAASVFGSGQAAFSRICPKQRRIGSMSMSKLCH